MPQIENPYQDKPSLARPVPGIAAVTMAGFANIGFKVLGINLHVDEYDGLERVCSGILRAYPRLLDLFKQPDPSS